MWWTGGKWSNCRRWCQGCGGDGGDVITGVAGDGVWKGGDYDGDGERRVMGIGQALICLIQPFSPSDQRTIVS